MIQTEQTPNPDSLKFISEKTISAVGTEEFQKGKINKISNPFIIKLLEFKGVELILLSKNFLSVKKNQRRYLERTQANGYFSFKWLFWEK